MPTLPAADAIIVGGTWGETERIIELCVTKLKPGGRIVIDTILIETMYKAITAIKKERLSDIEITQISITRGKNVSTGTMLITRNPVLVISATKA